jgi:hypothetical protein
MAIATPDDVRIALEKSALSADETAAASQRLNSVTAIICAAVDKPDESWFDALIPTRKNLVKGIAIDVVCRAMASPQGLTSASETLGDHTRSETYRRDSSTAMALTKTEELILRRMVYGQTTGAPVMDSVLEDIYGCEGS